MASILKFKANPYAEQLKEAIEARAKFLEENPKMQAYQDEITARLNRAGNQSNRIAVLSMMMQEKLQELGTHCTDFVEKARKVESMLKGEFEKQKLRIIK